MALTSSPSSTANASHSAASALSKPHGGAKRPAGIGADDDAGGFAAQLLRAQPDEPKPDVAADKSSVKDDKESDDQDDDSKDAKPAGGQPDPNALFPWQQQSQVVVQTTTTTMVAQQGADGADAADVLGGVRKGNAKGGKDVAFAALGADKDAKATDATAALAGKGSQAADPTAALARAEGAANAASHTRDSMAALLPQADPVAVQAGAIGASPTAVQDPNAGAAQVAPPPPAQAALPMAPQSPLFAPALGQQIEVWMRDGVQHAEVQLSPQDLGPIRVKIAMEGAQARVEMSADVQSTRDALQQALPQLSDSLGQVGLALTGGGVSDQTTSQSQAQDQARAQAEGFGSGARAGAGGRTRGDADGAEDFAVASAARQAAQRRGLLDMYA